MSQANVEIVRRAEAAISRRDVKSLDALLARDCEIVPMRAAVESIVFRGPRAALEWFAAQDESWESIGAEAQTYRHGDDWVLALGHIRAQGRSSGVVLDQPAAAIWRLCEGRITSVRTYSDRERALADLGLKE
jgi:ketosteroid isomerase-like protein